MACQNFFKKSLPGVKLFSAASVYKCELMNTDTTLREKLDVMNARVIALELENRLLRQKLDQYIRHYFGGQHNEGLDKYQLELLLQGLPNVITLPAAEPKTTTATRNGSAHPVRRILVEDKLETQEIVIEPVEVQAQPEGWKKISEERTSQLDWVAPKIIKRVFIRPRYVKAECFALAPLPPQPIEQSMVGPGLAGANSGQQIRISSTALPAGKNVSPTIRRGTQPQDDGLLGGTSRRVVETGVSFNSGRFAGGQLPASRRDADPVFRPGCERQKPARLSLGLQPTQEQCAI
jgi:hypothetical protein